MKVGLWLWPADQRGQQRVLRKVSEAPHLVAAMKAIDKSKEGLSNAEVDDALADYSNWMTRWVVEQLLSLGFAEYKVNLFGGPGKYVLTESGSAALSAVTGQPPKPKPAPAQAQPAVVPPKPAPTPPAQNQQTASH